MASTFDKKFETTETTKAADAEVVSEPISLSPRTADHVLTVTADSSCTAGVNVELEMSPDGQNWCPAVSRTISTSAGEVTGQIVGNEEYVKLTPDEGEWKNKHARGGLNFDVSGNVVTPDGTGARDLLDQHIAVNKSFNYSQWFKTSEAPTTTYKPVLFRHGGYDNFENTKTIRLISDTSTNLKALSLPYGNNVFGNDTIVNDATKAAKSPFYTSTNTNTMPDPSEGYAISLWFKADTVNNSGFRFRKLFKINFTNGGYFAVTWINNGSSTARYIRVYLNDGVNALQYTTYLATSAANSGWNHLVINGHQSGTTSFNFGYDFRPYLNGSALSNTQYTTGTTYTDATNFTVDNVEINSKWSSSFDDLQDDIYVDEIGFFKGTVAPSTGVGVFDTTYITSLYNNRHDITQASLPTGTELTTLLRCGDGADDVTTTDSEKIVNVLTTVNDFTLIKGSPTTGYESRIINLNSSDAPYAGRPTQNLCEPSGLPVSSALVSSFTSGTGLSISGWFKWTNVSGTDYFFTMEGGTGLLGMYTNTSNQIVAYYGQYATSLTYSPSTALNDGEWHHILLSLDKTTQTLYIDGAQVAQNTTTLSDADISCTKGLTFLSDGNNNALSASPASTDIYKLSASVSNLSAHSEVLDQYAAKQLYSNGHVRNAMNLPSINSANVEAFWQLNDTVNPENDLSGNARHLLYQDANSNTLVSQKIDADGATLVQDTINGNAMTLSLTKSFNFTTNEWVATADQETALCLSFNGFEEQAEHVALWKCSQTIAGQTIDLCDGGWHNVVLSYRGNNDLAGDNVAEGDVVKFGPGPAQSLPFNWCMSFDGQALTGIKDGSGADYIDGLGSTITDTYSSTTYNVGFNIYNRHLRYETSNTEEEYKPHAQFSAGIHEVTGVDNINAFQGSVDETSFHSDCWWVDQAGTAVLTNTFNSEKPATIYGNTTALTNRGSGSDYPTGVPYPLLNPELIGSASGGNQWINPERYDASTNPNGGLEGWWRWGDTPGDCSITINDVRDHDDSINARDIAAFGIVTADRQDMSVTTESIYLQSVAGTSTGGAATITFPAVSIEEIESGVCNLKNINSPILEFVRVKWTGTGSCDLGPGKGEAKICFTHRRKRK